MDKGKPLPPPNETSSSAKSLGGCCPPHALRDLLSSLIRGTKCSVAVVICTQLLRRGQRVGSELSKWGVRALLSRDVQFWKQTEQYKEMPLQWGLVWGCFCLFFERCELLYCREGLSLTGGLGEGLMPKSRSESRCRLCAWVWIAAGSSRVCSSAVRHGGQCVCRGVQGAFALRLERIAKYVSFVPKRSTL